MDIESYFSSVKLVHSPRRVKTPNGDRFIPCRKLNDNGIAHFRLINENRAPSSDTTPSKELYKSTLSETLFNGKLTPECKILNFQLTSEERYVKGDSSPLRLRNAEQEGGLPSPLKVTDSSAYSPRSSPQKKRKISTNPERILDAPELVDDYYLNLLDWSKQNVVAIALSRAVYLWNGNTAKSCELMRVTGDHNIVTSLSFVKDSSTLLAIGTNSSAIHIYDLEKAKEVRCLEGHSARVSCLDWNSTSNQMLSSGARDSMILNHDLRMSAHVTETMQNHTQEVCGLKWSPDGTTLASGGNDNLLCIWDSANTIKPRYSLTHHEAAVKALAWCPFQNNFLASGGGTVDRTIRFWNTNLGACVNSVDTKSQVCSIQWSQHYKELVSSHGYSQNQLIVWKFPSMEKITELRGHSSRVLHLAQSPTGTTVASAAGDETLRTLMQRSMYLNPYRILENMGCKSDIRTAPQGFMGKKFAENRSQVKTQVADLDQMQFFGGFLNFKLPNV